MKLYIVAHKSASRLYGYHLSGWSSFTEYEPNGVVVHAIHAFIRRKDATAYMKANGTEFMQVYTFENNEVEP